MSLIYLLLSYIGVAIATVLLMILLDAYEYGEADQFMDSSRPYDWDRDMAFYEGTPSLPEIRRRASKALDDWTSQCFPKN